MSDVPYTIGVSDPKVLLSRIVLQNRDIALKIAKTDMWVKDGVIEVRAVFNGIEASGEILEKALNNFVEQIDSHYKEHYDANKFDERVEQKAREILKEHADNALEKIDRLFEVLQDSDNIIKPHWER
jgi:ethanolamine utilization protein EutA (predicted chaperonin)